MYLRNIRKTVFEYYMHSPFRICSLVIYPIVKSIGNCCNCSIHYEALRSSKLHVSSHSMSQFIHHNQICFWNLRFRVLCAAMKCCWSSRAVQQVFAYWLCKTSLQNFILSICYQFIIRSPFVECRWYFHWCLLFDIAEVRSFESAERQTTI